MSKNIEKNLIKIFKWNIYRLKVYKINPTFKRQLNNFGGNSGFLPTRYNSSVSNVV